MKGHGSQVEAPEGWRQHLEQDLGLRRMINTYQAKTMSATNERQTQAFWEGWISEPIAIHVLSNREIVEERLIGEQGVRSWLCILLDGDGIIGAVELAEKDGRPRLRGIMRGMALQILIGALDVAASKSTDSYVRRILKCPGLIFNAFWLASVDSSRESFIPFVSKYGLEQDREYSRAQLLDALIPAAREELRPEDFKR